MKQQAIKYLAILVVITAGYIFLMQQVIEQGRYHHAQEDYLLEASLLAYNPVVDFLGQGQGQGQRQAEQATMQTFKLLNFIQFYDLLARGDKLPTTNFLGSTFGAINDQVEMTPHEKQLQRTMIQQVIPCRLIKRKQQQLIPAAEDIYKAYQIDFAGLLKIQLEEKQLPAIWQSLSCLQAK